MAETFRLRMCFRKTGRLRHLSHLETMRACERAARRARLPYAVTQGYTPRMRIAFGPALPVGTAGEREYFDLLLTRYVPTADVIGAFAGAIANDLAPSTGSYVSLREQSLAAALTIAEYEVVVKGGIPQAELESSLDVLSRAVTFSVERKGKNKVYDLTEALPKRPEVGVEGNHLLVRMVIRIGEQGSLRPEALVAAAVPEATQLIVTRTDLLIDDKGAWRRPL